MKDKKVDVRARFSRLRNSKVIEMCNYLSVTYNIFTDDKLKHKIRGMILGLTFACNGRCGKKEQISAKEYNERIDLSCDFAKNKKTIIDRIKELDEQFLITLDDQKSIEILGEIIALCSVIFCDIEKPSSINEQIWKQLCDDSLEDKKIEEAKFTLRQKSQDPKTTRDLLLNSYKDLLDN